jgi:RNA polymerase sigma factor (sigma-70 family)
MTPWFSELVLRSQSDERLVALARAGQDRAVAVIVERYRQPLLSYARRINPGSEEDLVQQTFLSMLTALQSGTEVRHLRGWLYGILRNLLVRAHAAPTSQLEDAEAATESAEHVAERRMLALDALGALSQLPPRQHNALLQVAIHGRSGSEVSEVMGLSEGALRQLVHRARATVRAAVTALTPFPLVRWLGNPRSGSTTALTEATISTGTASGAVAV